MYRVIQTLMMKVEPWSVIVKNYNPRSLSFRCSESDAKSN
jgi:hypothetical protein